MIADRIKGLLEALPDHVLDDAVHEEKAGEAAGINNDGPAAQVAYLSANGWTDEMILEILEAEYERLYP